MTAPRPRNFVAAPTIFRARVGLPALLGLALASGCDAPLDDAAFEDLADADVSARIALTPTTACPESSGERRWPISGELDFEVATDVVQDAYGGIVRGGDYYNHGGVDFRAPAGTTIHAVADGFVTRKCVWNDTTKTSSCPGHAGKGNFLVIQHLDAGPGGATHYTVYAHMQDFVNGSASELEEGDCVTAGEPIGRVGKTGTSVNTEHLHLSLHANLTTARSPVNSNSLNPWLVLPDPPASLGYTVAALGADAAGDLRLRVQVDARRSDLGRIEVARVQAGVEVDLQVLHWNGTGVLTCGPSCSRIEVVPTDFDPGAYGNANDPGDARQEWTFAITPASAAAGDEIYRVYDVEGSLVASGSLG